MERIENLFVPFKEAKELKKLGFDMECFGHFENEEKILRISYESHPHIPEEHKDRPAMFIHDNRNSKNPQWKITAPTYQQVFKWFMEEHGLWFRPDYPFLDHKNYAGCIHKIGQYYPIDDIDDCESAEEAELACIRRLIEIIKKK